MTKNKQIVLLCIFQVIFLLAVIYFINNHNQVNEVASSNHNDWPDGYYYKDGKNLVITPKNEKCFIDSKTKSFTCNFN